MGLNAQYSQERAREEGQGTPKSQSRNGLRAPGPASHWDSHPCTSGELVGVLTTLYGMPARILPHRSQSEATALPLLWRTLQTGGDVQEGDDLLPDAFNYAGLSQWNPGPTAQPHPASLGQGTTESKTTQESCSFPAKAAHTRPSSHFTCAAPKV